MNDKKLNRIKECIKTSISLFLNLLIALVEICVKVLLIFGATAAIILLYKMFPDVAQTLMEPMSVVFSVILKIFEIFLVIFFLLAYGYFIIILFEIGGEGINRIENRTKERKKKFMNDLVKKIKRGIKNK